MPLNRKLLGAAAFSLALAGGGVVGAVMGTPTLSGAQDDTDGASDASAEHVRHPHRGEALATAAEALGISEDELKAALAEGKSIADVAEEQGVDVQTVIDALVANATARLEEIEATLPERMADLVQRTGWGEHRPGPGHHRGEALATAAEVLGISEDELKAALADGSTLAEVAEANDVDVDTLIDALVAEATARIDAAVADGTLDEDRAEALKEDLEGRITARVNGERPDRGDGHRPGRRGAFGPLDGPPPVEEDAA